MALLFYSLLEHVFFFSDDRGAKQEPGCKSVGHFIPLRNIYPKYSGAHRYNRTGSGDKGGDGRWQKWLSSGNKHSNTRAQPRPRDKNVALSKHHVTANNNVSNIHTNTGTRGDMVEPLLITCWPEVSRRRYVKCWMVREHEAISSRHDRHREMKRKTSAWFSTQSGGHVCNMVPTTPSKLPLTRSTIPQIK